jgi:hypothetical protein
VAAGKHVVLVYPVPEAGHYVPQHLERILKAGGMPEDFTLSAGVYARRQQFTFAMLDRLAYKAPLGRIYPHQRLCDAERCKVYADDRPLYFDDDHLSLAGADYIAPLFEPLFSGAPPH